MEELIVGEFEEKSVFGTYSSIKIKKGGTLYHYSMPVGGSTEVVVEQGASYKSLLLLAPKEETGDVNVGVKLVGSGANTVSNAIYLLEGKSHFSLHMSVSHLFSDTHSEQYARGILNGSSFLDFVGLIDTQSDIQRVLGSQLNETIILSSAARLKCIPELSIISEDIKCTHGTSLGDIDEQQIFYLQSRGLTYNEAKYLILHSFTNVLITDVHDEFAKQTMSERINEWLGKNL